LVKVIVIILILQAIEVIPIEISIMAINITKENAKALAQDFSVLEAVVSLVAKNVSVYQ